METRIWRHGRGARNADAMSKGECSARTAKSNTCHPKVPAFSCSRHLFEEERQSITGTNWEGVGVVPDVKVSADEALAAALKLIRDRAPHQ